MKKMKEDLLFSSTNLEIGIFKAVVNDKKRRRSKLTPSELGHIDSLLWN